MTRRMELFVRDVNDVTNTLGKKCDVLVAVNYSICYFHSRTKLITVSIFVPIGDYARLTCTIVSTSPTFRRA